MTLVGGGRILVGGASVIVKELNIINRRVCEFTIW